jgi:hypothetical protein
MSALVHHPRGHDRLQRRYASGITGSRFDFNGLSILMICFAIIATAKILRQDKRASRIELSAL